MKITIKSLIKHQFFMNNQEQKELPEFPSQNFLNLQIYNEQCQQLAKQCDLKESLKSIEYLNKYSSSATLLQKEDYLDYSESCSIKSNESNTADYENDRQKLIIIKMYEIMQDFKQSNRQCVKRCNRKILNVEKMLAMRSLKIKK